MNNFRGFFVSASFAVPNEPYFDGTDFSTREKLVPTSVNYKLDDLLATGKVSPVSTEILHDSSAVDALVNSDVSRESKVVEPSNNQ